MKYIAKQGGLQQGLNHLAAKFVSQGDYHMRTVAQIKFLYYALFVVRVCKV